MNSNFNDSETEFSYHDPKMFNRTFIQSKVLQNENTKITNISFHDVTIEVIQTIQNKDEVIIVINGTETDRLAKGLTKKIEFQSELGKHQLIIWQAKVRNFLFTNIFFKEGLAITIDEIPVKNTLADPFENLEEGKISIWIFLILHCLSLIYVFLMHSLFEIEFEFIMMFTTFNLIYISIFIFTLLQIYKHPIRALKISLVVASISTLDFVINILSLDRITFMIIIVFILRSSAIAGLWRTLKSLTKFLARSAKMFENKLEIDQIAMSEKNGTKDFLREDDYCNKIPLDL